MALAMMVTSMSEESGWGVDVLCSARTGRHWRDRGRLTRSTRSCVSVRYAGTFSNYSKKGGQFYLLAGKRTRQRTLSFRPREAEVAVVIGRNRYTVSAPCADGVYLSYFRPRTIWSRNCSNASTCSWSQSWRQVELPHPMASRGRGARRVPPQSSRADADDRLSADPNGRAERANGCVESRSLADVRSQPSVPHPLHDLTQLGTIEFDDKVDR